MKLHDVEYGSVLAGAGTMGFFGEKEYWHQYLPGYSLKGMTLVAKTATLFPRKGNMPLTKRFRARWPLARCIRINKARHAVLNAVGLSNPGLGALLATGKWQALTEPFGISVMSLAPTAEQRIDEERAMAYMLKAKQHEFNAPFFIQINKSCPNTEHDPCVMIGESAESLEVFASVLPDVPRMPKFSVASAPIEAVMVLNDNPRCDAICVSNAILYDYLSKGADIWKTPTSPLAHLGGGGLSGAPIKPLVLAWIKELRDAGFTKPINGGGGIMTTDDIDAYHAVGVDSVFFASAAMLSVVDGRFRHPQTLIQYGNQLFGEKI